MTDLRKTTILITGANRGLIKGQSEHFLARPAHVVIAGVREPSKAAFLRTFLKGPGRFLVVVKTDSVSETNAVLAVQTLRDFHGITHLDIVVANAGISKVFPQVHEVMLPDLVEHMQVNVFAVILLFQAVRPLLLKADKPEFVTLGTSAASLSQMANRNFPNAVYGTSKATWNYITRKMHFESEWLVAFVLDPGLVQTGIENDGAKTLDFAKAEIPVDVSVNGNLEVVDSASRKETSGNIVL